jgi:alkylation response protein AidB-like acyl-CoA dehydrogenase
MTMDPQFDIHFGDEQAQLMDIAESFSRENSPIEAVRALLESDQGFDRSLWAEITELGWPGVAVPEEFGGSALGMAEIVPIVEAMGRRLFTTPYVPSVLAAGLLTTAANDEQKLQWLPRICDGAIAALALSEPDGDWDLANIGSTATGAGAGLTLSGIKTFVNDAMAADLMIVSVRHEGRPALALLDRTAIAGATVEREIVIDETRRSYRVSLDGVSVEKTDLIPDAAAALAELDLNACLLLSAEMCGGIAGVLDVVVEYLNMRRQFGRMIGSFQALKHPTVDILTGLEGARSLLYHAACRPTEETIRMAKAQAGDCLAFAADRAIQFHGGFGFTYECDAQLFRRRGLWGEARHGDAQYQRQKLATLLLDQ